jgi:hypothetical protein
MEAESGLALQAMAAGWLKRPGHPHVAYSCAYDAAAKTYTVDITQSGWAAEKPAGGWGRAGTPGMCDYWLRCCSVAVRLEGGGVW